MACLDDGVTTPEMTTAKIRYRTILKFAVIFFIIVYYFFDFLLIFILILLFFAKCIIKICNELLMLRCT